MRLFLIPLFCASGCQALTDPCWTGEDAPDKCVGTLRVEVTERSAFIDVEGAEPVVPNVIAVSEEDDACLSSVRLWELKKVDARAYPVQYGDVPSGAKPWINDWVSPDGSVPELVPGQTYTVSLWAKDRLDDSAAAPSTWSGAFIAGEPGSFSLDDERCDL